MIEDKELGVKMATNPIEALWEKVRRQSEIEVKTLEDSLIIQKEVMKLAENKLLELGK